MSALANRVADTKDAYGRGDVADRQAIAPSSDVAVCLVSVNRASTAARSAPHDAASSLALRLMSASSESAVAHCARYDARTHGDVGKRASRHDVLRLDSGTASALAHRLGRFAVGALHAELACAPKPGLVTPFDTGSHTDMDASTFLRSLFALRGYFVAIAQAGIDNAPFARLRQLGIDAEATMLRATGGINTHRGAIFSLGLLTAQAARLRVAHGRGSTGEAVCNAVQVWRAALQAAPLNPHSNSQRVRAQYRISGVREQAAAGYPLLREIALPCLRTALNSGATREAAVAQTLMQLVSEVDDLNLLHRGGYEGLVYAKAQARIFLADGGIAQPQWRDQLNSIGKQFVARRLSPGGSADLLACAWFLHLQESA